MDEIAPGPGPCPEGPRGIEGWGSNEDVSARMVDVHSILFDQERKIQTKTQEFLYIDRTNREMGIRLKNGGRVFISLDEVIQLIFEKRF